MAAGVPVARTVTAASGVAQLCCASAPGFLGRSSGRGRAPQARFAGDARSHGVAEAVEPVRALRGGLARQKVACTRVGTECSGVEPRSGGSHVNTPTSEHQRRPFFTECREEDHVGIQASSELKQSAESRKSYLGDEPYTEKATHPGRTAVCPPFCPRNARGLPFFSFFRCSSPLPASNIFLFATTKRPAACNTVCTALQIQARRRLVGAFRALRARLQT